MSPDGCFARSTCQIYRLTALRSRDDIIAGSRRSCLTTLQKPHLMNFGLNVLPPLPAFVHCAPPEVSGRFASLYGIQKSRCSSLLFGTAQLIMSSFWRMRCSRRTSANMLFMNVRCQRERCGVWHLRKGHPYTEPGRSSIAKRQSRTCQPQRCPQHTRRTTAGELGVLSLRTGRALSKGRRLRGATTERMEPIYDSTVCYSIPVRLGLH